MQQGTQQGETTEYWAAVHAAQAEIIRDAELDSDSLDTPVHVISIQKRRDPNQVPGRVSLVTLGIARELLVNESHRLSSVGETKLYEQGEKKSRNEYQTRELEARARKHGSLNVQTELQLPPELVKSIQQAATK